MGKQNNYGQGGGDGGRHRRFGGTDSLGNYDRGSGYRNLPDDNRRSGNWGGGDFRRSFDNSGNSGNNNNFGDSNVPPHNNKDDNRFQKFRDQHAQDQYRGRQGRNRNRNQRGGKQNYGKNSQKDRSNRQENRNGAGALQNEPQQDYSQTLPPPAPAPVAHSSQQVAPVAQLSQQAAPVAEHRTSSPVVPPPIQNDLLQKTELKENSPIIKNIKQERIEAKDIKQVAKPPASSSSSSESSGSESENEPPTKTVQEVVKSNSVKVKKETSRKPSQSSAKKPPTSSSSASSSEEDDSSDESTGKSKVSSKQIIKKIKKKPEKKKHLSEEDLVCLGKLERKFVIEDDASEDADVSMENQSATSKSQCLICDKQGHTAFECQMICKNCSAPYHNMKSCPKPANLSTMMQSFMEFCMEQMSQFNPEKKFIIPLNKSNIPKENILSTQNLQTGSAVQSKKSKKSAKSKEPPKNVAKRKCKYTSKSSDEEDEEEEEDDDDETEEEESDSSEEVVKQKIKKRRTKTPAVVDTPDYGIPFVPPFSSFPGFGATAATYNPLLLGQLMQSGVFGTPKKLK